MAMFGSGSHSYVDLQQFKCSRLLIKSTPVLLQKADQDHLCTYLIKYTVVISIKLLNQK